MSYTWNIIFIAIDTKHQDNENNAIQIGVDHFINDFNAQTTSGKLENVNVNILLFQNKSNIGTAQRKFYNKSNNTIEDDLPLENFNIHCEDDSGNYVNDLEKYFRDIYEITQESKADNKFIFILLSHSFSLGFAAFSPCEGCNEKYLSSINLWKSIDNGFNQLLLDCFIGVNCLTQNIVFNYLFSNNFKYMIGSQQTLDVHILRYTNLFDDINNSGLFDVLLFNKYLFDTNVPNEFNLLLLPESSISLINPKLTEKIFSKLADLISKFDYNNSKVINKKHSQDLEDIFRVLSVLEDISPSRSKEIFDAYLFFLILLELYRSEKTDKKEVKIDIIQQILQDLKALVINEFSGYKNHSISFTERIYFPFGVGLFVPQGDGVAIDIIFNDTINIIKLKMQQNQLTKKEAVLLIEFYEAKKVIKFLDFNI